MTHATAFATDAALRLAAAACSATTVIGLGILSACSTTPMPSRSMTPDAAAVAMGADADPKTVDQWQQMCSVCHGADGTSKSARSPVLAGQQAAYLAQQLHAFRSHTRANSGARKFMWPMAAGLSDAAIEQLAARFAALPPPAPAPAPAAHGSAGDGSPEEVAAGAAFYAQGPCSSCHGDKGQGIATFPRLAGQHADYTRSQLAAYSDDSRADPVMGPMAKTLSPAQARSIAAYLAAQR